MEATLALVTAFIDKELAKGGVYNDDTVEDYLYERANASEEGAQEILGRLLAAGRVYKFRDPDSYMRVVRARGLVAQYERYMIKRLADKTQQTIFIDTEYPIDAEGHFVLPDAR